MLGWTRYGSRATVALLLVLAVASVAGASARPGDDEAAVIGHMQALYSNTLERMDWEGVPRDGTLVIVVDAALGYEYTLEEGLRPLSPAIDTGEGNPATVYDELTDDVGALAEGSLKPLRRVKTKYGFFRLDGKIRLPTTLTGVDGAEGYDEGAFNYFGVNSPSADAEIGVCSRVKLGGDARNDHGRWYYYYSIPGQWNETNWPSGGIAPGTTVTLRLIVSDGHVSSFIDAGSSRTWVDTFNVAGVHADGADERLRRVTSMVLASNGGTMVSSSWSGLTLYNHTPGGPVYWRSWTGTETYYSPLPRLPGDSDSSPISYPVPGVSTSGNFTAETVTIRVPQ